MKPSRQSELVSDLPSICVLRLTDDITSQKADTHRHQSVLPSDVSIKSDHIPNSAAKNFGPEEFEASLIQETYEDVIVTGYPEMGTKLIIETCTCKWK